MYLWIIIGYFFLALLFFILSWKCGWFPRAGERLVYSLVWPLTLLLHFVEEVELARKEKRYYRQLKAKDLKAVGDIPFVPPKVKRIETLHWRLEILDIERRRLLEEIRILEVEVAMEFRSALRDEDKRFLS